MAYSGSMNVLKNVLGNEYLWNNVRVKGGAYGCMCGLRQAAMVISLLTEIRILQRLMIFMRMQPTMSGLWH